MAVTLTCKTAWSRRTGVKSSSQTSHSRLSWRLGPAQATHEAVRASRSFAACTREAQKDRGRPCASYTLPSKARAADVRDMLLFQRPERAFRLPRRNVLSAAWFLDSRSRLFVVNLRCSLRAFVGKDFLVVDQDSQRAPKNITLQ